MSPNAMPAEADDRTSFALAIRARDARTAAAIAFTGALPATFLAFHWHFLAALPIVAVAVGVDGLRRLVVVAAEHARLVTDKARPAEA